MPFPVQEHFIEACERQLNVRLPSALRTRYLARNGGDLMIDNELWILHPVRDGSSRQRISRTASDLVQETKLAREWKGFPPDGIALGSNGCGDHLVLMPQSKNPSELASVVYRWEHEAGDCQPLAELSELMSG